MTLFPNFRTIRLILAEVSGYTTQAAFQIEGRTWETIGSWMYETVDEKGETYA